MVTFSELAAIAAIYTGLLVFLLKYIISTLEGAIEDKAGGLAVEALDRRIGDLRDDVSRLDDAHSETRQVATTTYGSVFGDDNRPDDQGVIRRSKRERKEIREELDRVQEELEALKDEMNAS